jgi:glutamate/tyrosine decarboxylase-like PLP-dependent enzyme
LSRGFRALKTWFTLKTYGLKALGRAMEANCDLARRLEQGVAAHPDLELLAPVALNIVCFAYAPGGHGGDGEINRRIVEKLHAQGRVAPSLTLIGGRPAIRAAFVNHRSTFTDVDLLIEVFPPSARATQAPNKDQPSCPSRQPPHRPAVSMNANAFSDCTAFCRWPIASNPSRPCGRSGWTGWRRMRPTRRR